MTDRIDFGGEPWQAIPRSTLRDSRLSLKAHGALTTLLSHDEGWVRSVIATLMHETTTGRAGAQSAMKELVAAGYATWERKQDPATGQFRTTYTVFAVSQETAPEPASSPQTENPSTGNPLTEKHPVVVEALDVEALDVEPTSKNHRAPSAVADYFDSGKWRHLLTSLWDAGWADEGAGALTWPFLMKLHHRYGAAVVDSALSDATYNEKAPAMSSAAYFESICVRFQAQGEGAA